MRCGCCRGGGTGAGGGSWSRLGGLRGLTARGTRHSSAGEGVRGVGGSLCLGGGGGAGLVEE